MDIIGAIMAAFAWFQQNWNVIEPLARRLAEDLAALWILGLALAKVLAPFFPKAASNLEAKVLGVFKH